MEYENNFQEWLSEAHREFMLAYIEAAQAREQAAVSQFLESR